MFLRVLLYTKSESHSANKCRESLLCLERMAKILKAKIDNEHQALVIQFKISGQADSSVIERFKGARIQVVNHISRSYASTSMFKSS